jgi:hypothetical protein
MSEQAPPTPPFRAVVRGPDGCASFAVPRKPPFAWKPQGPGELTLPDLQWPT